MSLIQRSTITVEPKPSIAAPIILGCFVLAIFLIIFSFGVPTATTLDASWTEVLGWAKLRGMQWGRDIVFSYGPLGFLHTGSSYVPGILSWFVAGQCVIAAGFSLSVFALLWRRSIVTTLLFMFAFACLYPWIAADVSWAMILLFNTTILISREDQSETIPTTIWLIAFAATATVIVLIKFSLFPLWLLCFGALTLNSLTRKEWRHALTVLIVFPSALLLTWFAVGQSLGNLPPYLRAGINISAGYGQAMGLGTTMLVQIAGAACVVFFGLLCILAAWRLRRSVTILMVIALYSAAAFLAWRSNFTRADHAPWFFAYLAMMPFGLLCHPRLAELKFLRVGLIVLVLTCAATGLYPSGAIAARWAGINAGISGHFHQLTHLNELRTQRQTQWEAAKRIAALPEIRQQVRTSTVDVFTSDQSIALLNDLNYAPRPVFQSYAAYTPLLDRINERHYLGSSAPEFVIMQLLAIDGRLPMMEDPLALLSVLQNYQPVLMEGAHLLLRRNSSAKDATALTQPVSSRAATMDKDVQVNARPNVATIAFINLELTPLGRLCSLLLREPTLRISLQTDDGSYSYRFLRSNGSVGFMISPLIRNTADWARLQLRSSLPNVLSFRIAAETTWQQIFFKTQFRLAFETFPVSQVDPLRAPKALLDSFYPGFNLMPNAIHGISDIIVESGHGAVFLHAPGLIGFDPPPADYSISGDFGIRAAALNTPSCAGANGVGVSLVQIHDGTENVLTHLELDPFHRGSDRGDHHFIVDGVSVANGDAIEYRVDPGHGGGNTACDWSYVRNFEFTATAVAPQ